jgi:hypothetical protein
MTITYRPLTIKDKDQLIEIFESTPTVYNKYTDEQFQQKFKELLVEELNNPLCFFPSIFIDEKLYSTIFLKESVDAPSWIFTYYTVRGSPFTIIAQPGYLDVIIEFDKAITNEMIVKRNLNRMYYIFPYNEKSTLRSVGSADRVFSYIRKIREYEDTYSKMEMYTDCIVKANTLPKYPYQQKLIGDRTWPFDLAITIGMVKSNI